MALENLKMADPKYQGARTGRFDLNPVKEPDGYITIYWKGKVHRLYGGPYINKPDGMIGVKMAAEINRSCEIDIPTKDFNVPNVNELKYGIASALVYMELGAEVYVGCMGGIGRTGLFMAALLKYVQGGTHGELAVNKVRSEYKVTAVETQQQMQFINELVFDEMDLSLDIERTLIGRVYRPPVTGIWGRIKVFFTLISNRIKVYFE